MLELIVFEPPNYSRMIHTNNFGDLSGAHIRPAGSSSIAFKVTDAAGNDGATARQADVLDTTAPTTTIGTIDISADTGTSAADFETNTASQTITGTLSAVLGAGEILFGSVDNGSSWIDITAKVTGTVMEIRLPYHARILPQL